MRLNTKTIKEDSFRIYQHARRFQIVADILFSSEVKDIMLPTLTNAGISIELYLKSILNYESGGFPNIHELDELYKMLNVETQHKIMIFYNQELKKVDWVKIRAVEKESNVKNSRDLIFNLKELSRTIVDVRYFFDMKYSKGVTWYHIDEIKTAIIKVADELFLKKLMETANQKK